MKGIIYKYNKIIILLKHHRICQCFLPAFLIDRFASGVGLEGRGGDCLDGTAGERGVAIRVKGHAFVCWYTNKHINFLVCFFLK